MLRVLFRLPIGLQASVATGLFGAAGLFGLGGVASIAIYSETTKSSGALWWKKTTEIPMSERRPALIVGIGLFAIAALCVVLAIRLLLKHSAARKYFAILSSVESMKVQQVARITNTTTPTVYRDIESMIDSGMLEDFYIDYSSEQVISKKFLPKQSHKTVVTCSGCGNNNEIVVGITQSCTFCRQPLVLKKS